MNTSAFQCSVFIGVMMVVAVYSASVHSCPDKEKCDILLRHIKNASNKLLSQDLHGLVPRVYNEACRPHFFCLAEKVVEKNLTQPRFKDLQKYLHQYNNRTQTNCQLNDEMGYYQLKQFVQNVKKCADRLLNNTR